jgi:ribosomal protein S18 acetylase RimI-like enzyme
MRSLGSLDRRRSPSGFLRWRRAVGADIPALSAFLRDEEESRVGFSGRLLREGPLGPVSLHLPSALRGAVWVADALGEGFAEGGVAGPTIAGVTIVGPTIVGAVLCHPSRLVFPIFPPPLPAEGSEGDRDLALLASNFSPASAIGLTRDVVRYESALGLGPQSSVSYRLMSRPETAPPLPPCPRPYPGLWVRRASPADLEALLPLQEAYEREEVLTPIHEFNAPACRASLARALERQLVFAAEEGGVLVGKAGTNARGFLVDQIGGVYTLPARRGRGVAAALMSALLSELLACGRRAALFVKPSNAAALALYRGLGFEDIGDYRADYFQA